MPKKSKYCLGDKNHGKYQCLIPFVNATSVASDPVNLFEVHCSCLFNKKNLVSKLKLASTGSLVCWNLIGSSKVIGFLGVHSSGVEYSMSWCD